MWDGKEESSQELALGSEHTNLGRKGKRGRAQVGGVGGEGTTAS